MGNKSVLPMMQALSGVRIQMPDEGAVEEITNKEEDFVSNRPLFANVSYFVGIFFLAKWSFVFLPLTISGI